jgi:hypothetical protein
MRLVMLVPSLITWSIVMILLIGAKHPAVAMDDLCKLLEQSEMRALRQVAGDMIYLHNVRSDAPL